MRGTLRRLLTTGVGLGLVMAAGLGTAAGPATASQPINTPPQAITPVEVTLRVGLTAGLNAADLATDADGDPLRVTGLTVEPDPSVAGVQLRDRPIVSGGRPGPGADGYTGEPITGDAPEEAEVTVTGVHVGSTSLTITVSDGSDQVDVPVQVTVLNTPPGTPAEPYEATVAVGQTVALTAGQIAFDPDGDDTLTVHGIVDGPETQFATAQLGEAVPDGAANVPCVNLTGVAVGDTAMTVSVWDGHEAGEVTVWVHVVWAQNHSPVAKQLVAPVTLHITQVTTLTADLLATDQDAGDSLWINGVKTQPNQKVAIAQTATIRQVWPPVRTVPWGAVNLTGTGRGETSLVVTVTDGYDSVDVAVTVKVVNQYTSIALSPGLDAGAAGGIVTVDRFGAMAFHAPLGADLTFLSKAGLVTSGLKGQTALGAGDMTGDGKADLYTIDAAGTMWLFKGNGRGGVAPAVKVAGSWRGLEVIPAGDLTRDGRNDFLAVDQAGQLWLYRGNGSGGFQAGRINVGHGWTGFKCYAAQDLNGDGKADILSIRQDGKLFAYLGRGDGHFDRPVEVGHGWSTSLTTAGGADLNGDGLADIVARHDTTGTLYYYESKGQGHFKPYQAIAQGW